MSSTYNKKGPDFTEPLALKLAALLEVYGGGLRAMSENIAQIEPITEAGRHNQRIEVHIGPYACARPRYLRVEPGFLHVGIEIPAIAHGNVEPGLKREAERIVDTDV